MLTGKPGREAVVQLQIVGAVTGCGRGLSPHLSGRHPQPILAGKAQSERGNSRGLGKMEKKSVSLVSLIPLLALLKLL